MTPSCVWKRFKPQLILTLLVLVLLSRKALIKLIRRAETVDVEMWVSHILILQQGDDKLVLVKLLLQENRSQPDRSPVIR